MVSAAIMAAGATLMTVASANSVVAGVGIGIAITDSATSTAGGILTGGMTSMAMADSTRSVLRKDSGVITAADRFTADSTAAPIISTMGPMAAATSAVDLTAAATASMVEADRMVEVDSTAVADPTVADVGNI